MCSSDLVKGSSLALFFALFVSFSATQMFLDKKPAPSRQMPGTAEATAFELFAVLRELDASGVDTIWVERPPLDAAWDGVRDRLQRAAAA